MRSAPLFSRIRISTATLWCLGAALVSCDGSTTGPDEKRIGPGGGTAILAEGAVTLWVPPGALSDDVWFTVTPAVSVPTSDLLVPGSSWEIGPPGTTFSHPVTLSISYDPGHLPDGVGETGLGVAKVAGSDWVLMANTSSNPSARTASGEVNGLGRYGVSGLPVESVQVAPESSSLEPGDSLQLLARALAPDGRILSSKPVSWSSSNPATASVTSYGMVMAGAEGTATITASCEGFSASATVSVRIPVAWVEVSPGSSVLNLGQTLQLEASARDANNGVLSGRPVTWASNDLDVVTVSGSGLVTTRGAGSATIVASVEGRHGTATIAVHSLLDVATSSLAAGVVGEAYSQTLAASGGNGGYLWSIEGGSLPPGLSLTPSTGVISGTPTVAAEATFSVKVTSAGQTATKPLSIEVRPIPVTSVMVLPGSVGLSLSETLQFSTVARDAAGNIVTDRPVEWESSDPDVASISSSGLLTANGVGNTTVTATVDGHPGWASVTVYGELMVADSSLPSAVVDKPYSHTLTAIGGDGENTWSILAGDLPPGLTLDSLTGELAGAPVATGTTSFIVEVASGDGQSATRSLSVVAYEALSVSTEVLVDGIQMVEYEQTLAAVGGLGPYTWSAAPDTLPTGLWLDEVSGVIDGTPVFEGSSSFTVTVLSEDGQTATRALSITVHPEPVSSVEVTPPSATTIVGQTQQLTATARDTGGNILVGRTVFWTSSDSGVATVDIDGLVTGVGVGSSVVTATVDGVSDMSTITVYEFLEVVTVSLADGVAGSAYSQTLAATGGNGTYGWTMTSGALPPGLTLDGPTGVISGTPATAGVGTFIIQVVSGGQTATRLLSITIG